MNIRDYFVSSIIITLFFVSSTTGHAKNCIKGKPCGNGCIALDKNCRITRSGEANKRSALNQSVLRKSKLRLPKVYVVTTLSISAREAPFSNKITGHYKQGQSVFVYQTDGSWARLSNMQPEEWVELEYLRLK